MPIAPSQIRSTSEVERAWLAVEKECPLSLSAFHHKNCNHVHGFSVSVNNSKLCCLDIELGTPNDFKMSSAMLSAIQLDQTALLDAPDTARETPDDIDPIEPSHWPDLAQFADNDEAKIREHLKSHTLAPSLLTAIKFYILEREQEIRRDAQQESLERILGAISIKKNKLLAFVAMFSAAGVEVCDGKNQTETAKLLGVTRAAVSKEANYWRDLLHLASRGMRSQQARENYSKAQKEKSHWRKAK